MKYKSVDIATGILAMMVVGGGVVVIICIFLVGLYQIYTWVFG